MLAGFLLSTCWRVFRVFAWRKGRACVLWRLSAVCEHQPAVGERFAGQPPPRELRRPVRLRRGPSHRDAR
eukprot:4609781-Prymnesium_polylepis.1